MRSVAIVTLLLILGCLVLSTGCVLGTNPKGLVPINTRRWSGADVSYLVSLTALALSLVWHAALPRGARFARTVYVSSIMVGTVSGTLAAVMYLFLGMFGAGLGGQNWATVSMFFIFVLSVLPAAMTLAVGSILRRAGAGNGDAWSRGRRLKAVWSVVGGATVVVLLAVFIPRIARWFETGIFEMGIWG